jgi:predicted dinucleotide-binding enzyme
MNIGVIGTGQIGEVIIRKLSCGYPVKMANARDPESLKNLAANTGAIPPVSQIMTFQTASKLSPLRLPSIC